MDPEALQPFAEALRAFYDGDRDARLIIRRDDGLETALPVNYFFRAGEDLSPIDRAALAHAGGRVLDAGAGCGVHCLVLERQGLAVTAIDICPQAVEIMKARGVKDARCANIFSLQAGPFDTMLLLGHGIGMVGTMHGLKRLFDKAGALLARGGTLLLDSVDVRCTSDPGHLAYHRANQLAGRYVGQILMQFQFLEHRGPFCNWLHLDPDTLKKHAGIGGWQCEVILQLESGEYLARLSKG